MRSLLNYTCSFIGPNLVAPERLPELRKALLRVLSEAVVAGARHFYCALLPGYSACAASAVLELKQMFEGLTLTLVVTPNQSRERWGRDFPARAMLCREADARIYLPRRLGVEQYLLAKGGWCICHCPPFDMHGARSASRAIRQGRKIFTFSS
ncbi:MAG: hypothetical protein ACOX6U_01050 [Oscillospiraceae bacterium]|jgi:hypothetical protein